MLMRTLACVAVLILAACASSGPLTTSTHGILSDLHERTGIAVVIQKHGLQTTLGSLPVSGLGFDAELPERFGFVAQCLYDELCLYPKELFQKTKTSSLVLCRKLLVNGESRVAVPDLRTGTLYVDYTTITLLNIVYFTRYLHHEIFHLIDFAGDGTPYDDERWRLLNPEGFQYGSVDSDKSESAINIEVPGFLSRYAQTALVEDKAELHSFIMVYPGLVDRRSRLDRVLNSKVETIKEYLAQVCPAMGKEYWAEFGRVDVLLRMLVTGDSVPADPR